MTTQPNDIMRIGFRTATGVTIRYAASDSQRDHLILLTNPWPESLYAFLPMWQTLAQQARLIAIDLPGFGQSERNLDLLTPQAMGEFLLQLIEEWQLEAPHIVGPDVGTSAALFAAAQRPAQVRSLVIGSGATAYPLQVGGRLKEFIEAPDLDAFRAVNFRAILSQTFDSSFDYYKLPHEVLEDYLTSYDGDRFVESMRYVRSYPQQLPILAERLAQTQTPVQIINNRRDPLVPPVNGEYLHERLPHSKLANLDAGHFAWEDVATQYAALITAWTQGGYQQV
jgi:pimeloyl-ACP methyl ester carboxylesterase